MCYDLLEAVEMENLLSPYALVYTLIHVDKYTQWLFYLLLKAFYQTTCK